MSEDNGSSEATTVKQKECAKEFIVSDKFKKMMDTVFEAANRVLKTRYNNITRWNKDDQEEFLKIFGVPGNTIITSKYSAKNESSFLSEEVEARVFMQEGIQRLLTMCEKISVGTRKCKDGINLYGNFVNNTHISPGSARVEETQTIGLSPDNYAEKLRIEILHNFEAKKNLFGHNSRVSTLCHELSHFCRYYVDEKHCGAFGSKDSPTKEFNPNYNYDGYASDLVRAHDSAVFMNAYNIERYFEITS